MIPIQDVIPSGRVPVATLALIAVNVIAFFLGFGHQATVTQARLAGPAIGDLMAPFSHTGLGPAAVGLLLLWLFGDNVEARLGRLALLGIYLAAGWWSGLGAAGAITAVLGAYFTLLPRSRVLVLVPLPVSLVEVPASFFLGVWAVLHLIRFVAEPSTLWGFLGALALGALAARVMRQPDLW